MQHMRTYPLSLTHKYIAVAHGEGVRHRNRLTVKIYQLHFKWLFSSSIFHLPVTVIILYTWLTHYQMSTHIYANKYILLFSLILKKQMQNRFTQVRYTTAHIYTYTPGFHHITELSPQHVLCPYWECFGLLLLFGFPSYVSSYAFVFYLFPGELEDRIWWRPSDWAVTNPLTT